MNVELEQITIPEKSERYYRDPKTGIYYPSVSFVLSVGYPTSTHLVDWQMSVGKEEATARLKEAGEAGSRVHDYIDRLIKGEHLSTAHMQFKEKKCIAAFLEWYEMEEPQFIECEYQIWNKKKKYAGTVDGLCRIKRDNYESVWLIDYKSSKSLYDKHRCQIAAYVKADLRAEKGALLHLGNTTRKGYTFSEVDVEDYWVQFELALRMFYELRPDQPEIASYPEVFALPSEGGGK